MKKLIVFSLTFVSFFTAINCSDEPIPPCTDCPQPLDTTTHEFLWQVDTLGDGNSSILHDVVVINDTLAFAVGEIFLRESLTEQYDPNCYNVAKWNGKDWVLLRVPVRDFGGATGYYPLYTVFAFGANDVWFASDADLIHWDGVQFTPRAFFMTEIAFDGQVRKIWGTNGSNLYCVGKGGAIYHFNGSTWQKLESGTSLPIIDIWGSRNLQTEETEILAVASDPFFDRGNKLLRISITGVESLSTAGLPWNLASVWFNAENKYFVVGGGMYTKDNVNSTIPWDTLKDLTIYKTNAVRGTGLNDIVVVGASGTCLHYNGSTWSNYPELIINGSYFNVDKKNKTVALCGWVESKAIVVIGKQR